MEDKEEKKRMKTPQQTRNNTGLPKPAQERPVLKISVIKEETMKRDREQILFEQQRALLEVNVNKSKAKIRKLKKSNAADESRLKQLEEMIRRDRERELHHCEEFLKRTERESADDRTLLEKEEKSKREKNAAHVKLTDEIQTIESDHAKMEEILNNYQSYKTLFTALTLEWKEAQEAEAGVQSDREAQESAARQGVERGSEAGAGAGAPSSTGEATPPPAHDGSAVTDSEPDGDKSEHEEQPEPGSCDPQRPVNRVTELREQCLSLIRSNMADEIVEELKQTIMITLKKMEEGEEKLNLLVNNKADRKEEEKVRAVQLKKKVQIYTALKSEDRGKKQSDNVLDPLGKKVKKVHRCCVDSRLTSLSTLEKLSSVEYRLTLMFQQTESIPEEILETLWQIKDSERRSRLREENQRLEREKQIERMKKCIQRSLGDAKKISGRRLMPRCIPVEQKIKVSSDEPVPTEDRLHMYLFTAEDAE